MSACPRPRSRRRARARRPASWTARYSPPSTSSTGTPLCRTRPGRRSPGTWTSGNGWTSSSRSAPTASWPWPSTASASSPNTKGRPVPHFVKPAAGSWTAQYPELGTGPVDYTDSIDPAYYEAEREAVFRRTWLNVGRVERVARPGNYFTKELAVLGTSLVIVKGTDGQIRAFHNVCRHRGNKLVW